MLKRKFSISSEKDTLYTDKDKHIITDLSSKTFQARKQWNEILKC